MYEVYNIIERKVYATFDSYDEAYYFIEDYVTDPKHVVIRYSQAVVEGGTI